MERRKLLRSGAFFIMLVCLGTRSSAQVVAKGGELFEMHSPMVVNVPFKEIIFLGGTYWKFPDLRKYVCDGVDIKSLQVKIGKMPAIEAHKLGKLVVDGTLYVRPSRDRRVDLQFDLLHGQEVIANSFKKGIDAEEDESKGFSIKILLKPEKFQTLLSDRDNSSLRITMTVR